MAYQNDRTTTANDRTKDVAQEAKAEAQTLKTTVQAKANQVADKAQEEVSDVAKEAEVQARRVAQKAEEQVRSMATERKGQMASELDNIAQAFRTSGQQLQSQDQSSVAGYANQVADQVEQASSYLRNRSVEQMVGDVEDFARQQPELFLAGALSIGLLISRFFKSSERSQYSTGGTRRHGSGYGYDYNNGYEQDEYELARRPRPLPQRDETQDMGWE